MTHQKLENEELTLAEILREKGYNTVGFAGGAFCKAKYGIGQGFTTYKDRLDFFELMNTFDRFSIRGGLYFYFPNLHDSIFGTDRERPSEEINKDVFRWLENNKDSTFFMFINYFDPHSPYNKGFEFKHQFTDENRDYSEVRNMLRVKRYDNVSEHVLDYTISLYDTEIFYLDYHIGKLLNKLDELGLKNNTIIIITADHGEEFYEHGGFDHGLTLYEEVIHVPFIIYYPKEFEPQRIEKRVENMNIFSTILDILEIEEPENIDSLSLVPLMKRESGYDRKYAFSQLFGRLYMEELEETNQQSVSVDDWKLIEVSPEKETLPSSLFNLKTDPEEQKNLYDKYSEKKKLLEEYIADITENTED
jgi:arylsulfatase A-like enzyme